MKTIPVFFICGFIAIINCGFLMGCHTHDQKHEGGPEHRHTDKSTHNHTDQKPHEHEALDSHKPSEHPDHLHAPTKGKPPTHPAQSPASSEPAVHSHPEEVFLPLSQLKKLDIQTDQVFPTPHSPSLRIPGEILMDPDRRVTLSAQSRQRIVALHAPPHSTVKPGQLLAVMDLVDESLRAQQTRAVTLQAELLTLSQEHQKTERYLTSLQNKNPAAPSELQRVKSELDVLIAKQRSTRSELRTISASLKMAGLTDAQLRALENQGRTTDRIKLFAPKLKGGPEMEVSYRPIHAGQIIEAGKPIFELTALDKLLVRGEAFESDLPVVRNAIQSELGVEVYSAPTGRQTKNLKIFVMEGILDAEARITHFFMRLDNQKIAERSLDGHRYLDWEYRAGERVQVLIPTQKPRPRFVLPIAALVRRTGATWVFRLQGNRCQRVGVRLDYLDAEQAVVPINAGLHPGDELVVSGALHVQLAIEKNRQGGLSNQNAHGHAH